MSRIVSGSASERRSGVTLGTLSHLPVRIESLMAAGDTPDTTWVPNLLLQRAPIAFPPDWPTDSRPLFEPAVVDARGAYVVGCAAAIAVFQVFSRSRAWFTIKAQTKITGYAVSSSALYVQDGPVISGWDLTYGGCFRGFNIVTRQEWKPPKSENPLLVATPPASLFDTSGAATNDIIEFSAPVVRESQLQGEMLGQVFVLGSDGSIHGFDDGLNSVATAKFRAPLRPELVMGELPQPSGDVLCRLYYVDKSGAIVAVNGSLSPLKELTGWAAKGTLDPAKVLPLRFIDGLLWGGGILGADFFALSPEPTQSPRLTVPAKNVWRDYDVETDEGLAVVTDGKISRLVAYGEGVKQRDRWGERNATTSGQSRLWPGVGRGAMRGPALALEIDDGVNASGVGFRVVLANTVDATDPTWTPNYPPQSTQLDAAIMTPGSFKSASLGAIASVRSKAIVARHTLYCVVRGAATGPDLLAIFALAPERASILDKANATLTELRLQARAIRLHVIKDVFYRGVGVDRRDPPVDASNVSCQVMVHPHGIYNIKMDPQGVTYLDPKYHGSPAAIMKDPAPFTDKWRAWLEPQTITLDATKDTNDIRVSVIIPSGKALGEPSEGAE
jgi:hypothetical protein